MSLKTMSLFFTLLLPAHLVFADVKYLDDVMAQATDEETKDLAKLLMQVQTVSTRDPQTGQMWQKVVRVEKGSVYERAGVKKGDLLANGKSGQSKNEMELKSSIKSSKPETVDK